MDNINNLSKVNYALDEVINHLFQLSHFEQEAPIFERIAPVSCFFVKSQVDYNFCKPNVTIWLLMTKLGVCIDLGNHLIISSIFLLQVKKQPKQVPESRQFVNFKPWKVLWNWIDYYWNFCHTDIQESSCEDSATLNFLGRAKGPGEFIFQAFAESKMQNLPSVLHCSAASERYWLRYKPLILSYSRVGTYEPCKAVHAKLL